MAAVRRYTNSRPRSGWTHSPALKNPKELLADAAARDTYVELLR